MDRSVIRALPPAPKFSCKPSTDCQPIASTQIHQLHPTPIDEYQQFILDSAGLSTNYQATISKKMHDQAPPA